MLRPSLAEAPYGESIQYVQISYLKGRKARVLCSNHGYWLLRREYPAPSLVTRQATPETKKTCAICKRQIAAEALQMYRNGER